MAEAKRFAGRSVEARVCLQHAQEAETQAELERLRKLDEVSPISPRDNSSSAFRAAADAVSPGTVGFVKSMTAEERFRKGLLGWLIRVRWRNLRRLRRNCPIYRLRRRRSGSESRSGSLILDVAPGFPRTPLRVLPSS